MFEAFPQRSRRHQDDDFATVANMFGAFPQRPQTEAPVAVTPATYDDLVAWQEETRAEVLSLPGVRFHGKVVESVAQAIFAVTASYSPYEHQPDEVPSDVKYDRSSPNVWIADQFPDIRM